MNVLFLSLGRYWSIRESEGYTDRLREFIRHGHRVFILSPTERREGKAAQVIREENAEILKIKTGNIQKTNFIEKGISTLLIEKQFLRAVKKHYGDVRFDLVLYPTPPITFVKVVEFVKRRDRARTYLLLKDIFPQNAVDIGLMSQSGVKGLLYRYFRKKEQRLYRASDRIGCMSPANANYVLAHNPDVPREKVEVCPNVIEIADKSVSPEERNAVRAKYGLPAEKTVFVYGGNLGRPQGIDFMIRCLERMKDEPRAFFLIAGDGTEYSRIEEYIRREAPGHVKLIRRLPKEEYDTLVAACDVGLIFLDHRFTIPNYPSRVLGYMQAKLPVLACTDPNTDIGQLIVEGGFGAWCESDSADAFAARAQEFLRADTKAMGARAYDCLTKNFTTGRAYDTIMRALEQKAPKS